MKIYVAVREGDYATFTHDFSSTVIDAMEEQRAFDGADQVDSQRWIKVDKAIRTCTVEVSDADTIASLTMRAIEAAYAAQLTKTDPNELEVTLGPHGFRVRESSIYPEGFDPDSPEWLHGHERPFPVIRTWIADPVTGSDYTNYNDGRIEDSDLADGDLVILCVEHSTDLRYIVISGPEPEYIMKTTTIL
jgi:hypothetical protein